MTTLQWIENEVAEGKGLLDLLLGLSEEQSGLTQSRLLVHLDEMNSRLMELADQLQDSGTIIPGE